MLYYPCPVKQTEMQILTRQQAVKRNLRNLTLCEWMCYEAENVVKHNSTDVSVWDRKLVNRSRPGDVRLWWIHEFGSQFLPMYCKLYEKERMEEGEYELTAVEVNLMRMFKHDRLGEIQRKIILGSSKFFFIIKGDGDFDYCVIPITFEEVVDLVFNGKANQFLN
jgi:hypothetical protein